MTSASAPGKIILLGEHAVVYRRPALAVPLSDLQAWATVEDSDHPGIHLISEQADVDFWLHEADDAQPVALAVRLTLQALELKSSPDLRITIDSDLPIAAGLGSGAAVSVAVIRALSQHLGHPLSPTVQATLAYEVEKLHHGTPSGIDNTVVAHEAPVFFIKGAPLETFPIDDPFTLVIADTGIPSPTGDAVAGVRERWKQDKARYEGYFDEIGQLAQRGRQAMA
ncbi:MAG: mevalonate kinase, partial [Anaerolineales bacterium]